MTGTASTWPNWIDALVAGMRATAGYRNPSTAAAGIPVYDGPELGLSAENTNRYLIIGWSGDPDQPESPGNAGQTEATAGPNRSRDETGIVTCRALTQLGDASIQAASVKAARDATFAILADVESFVRGSPNMALGLTGQVRLAQIAATRTEQWLNEGAICAVTFDVGYLSRI
jgi:hypothetical protein